MNTATPTSNASELRFLVVEDQGFQRWVVAHLLEGLGAKYVFNAADGQDALEIFKSADPPIDIIVTDLNMPGMDGMEFIRHVGAFGIPASIVLASDLDRGLVASVEAMTQAYGLSLLGAIQKPVTSKKLEAAISRHRPAQGKARVEPVERAFTLEEIARGIANDEFEPYFQPKIDLRTREVRGAEAVARWRHPTHGIVFPDSFIRTLEASWEIDGLTTMMLQKATACCRTWRVAGLDASVSVNVSLASLTDVSLADRLAEIVVKEQIEPRDVILEVTETAASSELGKVLENLARLRMNGFGLSIDDYGTGYSSMQQLTRIPFTELKIDKSFVRNAPTQHSIRAALESSLEIAQKLKIVSVGEGVESKSELVLLQELGCQLAQGYYIAKPMEAGDHLGWVKNQQLMRS